MTDTEPARIREHGTPVHRCLTATEAISAAQSVIQNGYAKVNGEMLDSTTAAMLVAVHKAITAQTVHPDFWGKVERMFARIAGDGTKQGPRAALRWLVNFGWKLAR